MPLFEVTVHREVTQGGEVQIEAATKEAAQAAIELALAAGDPEGLLDDMDWNVVDSQDDGSVWDIKELKTETKEG
jgi:hypothetical protein